MFKQNLCQYFEYLKKRPNSLISKIYGIFSFKFIGADAPHLVVLMENIAKVDKQFVINCYDLKGNTSPQKVSEPEERVRLFDVRSRFLRDSDFKKKEQSLTVAEDVKPILLK